MPAARALPLAVLLSFGLALAQPRNADQWYAQGQQQRSAGNAPAAAVSFQRAAELNPSAANWRNLADTLALLKDYDGATSAYDKAVARYEGLGDAETARALKAIADKIRPEFQLYQLSASSSPYPAGQPLAKLEPPRGCYVGAYVGENGITGTRFALDSALGVRHAIYFRYHLLRRPESYDLNHPLFPSRLAAAARADGAAIHLALEPDLPLNQITPAVVQPFAEAVRDAKVPVFVRFASEFNDPGNAWSNNPAAFVRAFRVVHDTLARIAPQAAMVWTPMATNLKVVDAYYPGRAYVDWVGITLYSTVFVSGNVNDPGEAINPLDRLDELYRKYAPYHPFQVSEFGAAHANGGTGDRDYTAFAVEKLSLLYYGAMLRYPRLKDINWLDLNMTNGRDANGKPATRQSDYTLLGSDGVKDAYLKVTGEPYFLHRFGAPFSAVPAAVNFPLTVPRGPAVTAAAWVKGAAPVNRVRVLLDGKLFAELREMPYRFILPTASLALGKHDLRFTATDAGA
ncbi:MAG TPA: glycosyl hydrolase, partial [Deinococcales bacterium]|nr:glycosyl hydrolase [Deinococcales bacterium]